MTDRECKSEYELEIPACAGMTERHDVFLDLGENRDEVVARKGILVHSCCGPCSTSVVEFLVPDYDVTLFFYNPNITDADEYERRLDAQRKFVEQYNENPDHDRPIKLIVATYNPEEFYVIAKDHEDAPEGGSRCTRCFELRISKTAAYAAMHSYETFTTTLSVSPHKDFERISRIGLEAALKYAVNFHVQDFKKKDGYRRSCELAKAYGLYRQNYCGCEYSLPHSK
jgi:predicted adenine nucleotide alpha hydrolase (AANH) superfamily ATPase